MNPRRQVEEAPVVQDGGECFGCAASKRVVEDVRAENMRLNMLLKEQHETILQMTLAMERKDEQMKIIQSNTEAYKFTICELEKRLAAPASTGTAVKGKGDAGKKHQVVGSDCVGGWKRLPAAPTTCEDVPPPPPQPEQQQTPLATAAKLRGGWKRLPAAPTTCVDVPPPPPQQPESCGGVGSASTTVKRKRPSLPAIPQGSLSTEQMLSTSSEEQATAKKHKPHARCEHGREKRRCKECKGSGICEHNHVKFTCKLCNINGQGGICIHNRDKYNCTECGSNRGGICQHNRRRARCKECGGGSICEHKRQRRICKECKGADICSHLRIKQYCADCGGASICQHRRVRRQCKECAAANKSSQSQQAQPSQEHELSRASDFPQFPQPPHASSSSKEQADTSFGVGNAACPTPQGAALSGGGRGGGSGDARLASGASVFVSNSVSGEPRAQQLLQAASGTAAEHQATSV